MCGFLCVCVGQVEEPSILSDGEDAVDSRQWTQHHLAAADIRMPPSMALTPPQGEFDSDCMDVNVRGPGNYYFCLYAVYILTKLEETNVIHYNN